MIFGGSTAQGKMNRASAALVFDNSKREFPLEFVEVSIARRVYRDGSSEYLINDSEVRLKDVIELLAKVGFGSTQHHIIGQGEADRILYSSAAERREMVEDALGLKIFHLRRSEAERKCLRTEENIKQVESIQKEIQP
ncbi:MAG: Chromosome partition protein smc, partial [Candidatus Giovannonibacteria bacterium GW2011_GWA2_44_26]